MSLAAQNLNLIQGSRTYPTLHFLEGVIGMLFYVKFFFLGWALFIKSLASIKSLTLITFGTNIEYLK
jgi:hypothetical protein